MCLSVQNDKPITTKCIYCWSWTPNCYEPCIYSCTLTLKIGCGQLQHACLLLQCYYCSPYHFTQGWETSYYHRADPELQGLMVCSLQHDKIFNALSNSRAQYPVLDVQYKVQVFTQTAITTHAWHIVLVHLVYCCTATLEQCVLVFVHKTEILQLKCTNCLLVTTQDLVFSVYNLSPCTVIRHPSLHTSSQDMSGITALMIASFRGHSNVVRKLLQAGATVNTTSMVRMQVL